MRLKSLLLLILLLPAAVWPTNGYLQIGYGVKAKGMGGTGIAYPQDAFAVAHNPAGMVQIDNRYDVGVHWLSHHASARGFNSPFVNPRASSSSNLLWPEAGIVRRFCNCQSFGLAIYAAGGWQLATKQPLFGTSRRRMSDLVYFLTPSWSWQINCVHSVGIAVNLGLQKLSIGGDQDRAAQSIAPGFVTDRGKDGQFGISLRLGWMAQVTPSLKLGATYQTKTRFTLHRKYRGNIAGGGEVYLPSQIGVGAAWWPHCRLVLAADLVGIFWTDARLFRNRERTTLFGADNGPGLGWRDQLVVKIGAAWTPWDCLTVRAGYNHGHTPLPTGSFTNISSVLTVQDHLTAGLSIRFGCNELSIEYVGGLHHSLRGKKPTNPVFTIEMGSRQQEVGISFGRRF